MQISKLCSLRDTENLWKTENTRFLMAQALLPATSCQPGPKLSNAKLDPPLSQVWPHPAELRVPTPQKSFLKVWFHMENSKTASSCVT